MFFFCSFLSLDTYGFKRRASLGLVGPRLLLRFLIFTLFFDFLFVL